MASTRWVAIHLEGGRVHLIDANSDVSVRFKGLGRFVPTSLDIKDVPRLNTINDVDVLITEVGLRELSQGLQRRAQTIQAKDAGFILEMLGVRAGHAVIEAGTGSGAMTIAFMAALGPTGHITTVESRNEHAEVARHNIDIASSEWEAPDISILIGDLADIGPTLPEGTQDVAFLDLPSAESHLDTLMRVLKPGGRFAAYLPVSSQLEAMWIAAEDRGCYIEWMGELMQRPWSRAMKGGVRPANHPFGHTAFLFFARTPCE